MVNAVRNLLLRDKKETELDGIVSSIKHCEEKRTLYKDTYDRTLEYYKEWLAKNKLQGVKYLNS